MKYLSLCERLLVFYGTRVPNHPRKWWLHDRLRRLFGTDLNSEFEVSRGGLKWLLNPADFTDASLFWFGSKDYWDIFHLRKVVKPGACIFDIGANFGYYSLTLALSLSRSCHIFALEPNPANFMRLCRHIKWNDLDDAVQAFCMGVDEHCSHVSMTQPPENSGHAFVDIDGKIKDVKLTTLDQFSESHGVERLDLVILDVEGYEERALRGAESTLRRFRPVIFVELFPPVMKRQEVSPAAVTDMLTSLGYNLFVARKNTLVPLPAIPTGDSRENVFCFYADCLPKTIKI